MATPPWQHNRDPQPDPTLVEAHRPMERVQLLWASDRSVELRTGMHVVGRCYEDYPAKKKSVIHRFVLLPYPLVPLVLEVTTTTVIRSCRWWCRALLGQLNPHCVSNNIDTLSPWRDLCLPSLRCRHMMASSGGVGSNWNRSVNAR